MKRVVIKPRPALFTLLFLLLITYSLFQARFLILGPQVWIENPADGAVVSDPIVVVSGTAKNVAWISLNDRQIFTNEEGWWSEKLIVAEGLSIMTVRVRDRFDRETEKQVRIILN